MRKDDPTLPHLEGLNYIAIDTLANDSTQNVHNKEEKKGGKRVSLSKASCRHHFTLRAPVIKEEITHVSRTTSHPQLPVVTKALPLQNVIQEIPIHTTISFFKINLKKWFSMINLCNDQVVLKQQELFLVFSLLSFMPLFSIQDVCLNQGLSLFPG